MSQERNNYGRGQVLASLFLISIAVGCHRYDGPPIAPVTGIVKLDGQPLPDATVRFQPVANEGTYSSGTTDQNGKFELQYTRTLKGALVGTHHVAITTGYPDNEDEFGNPQPIPEILPPIYHRDSNLKEEVTSKQNHIEFNLQSKR